ncbi:MAG TPA: hypothetical protein VFJ16_30445, partial [Longimicrobium sp.]|nr:hypothetical protein [Longimicrobium sp.]
VVRAAAAAAALLALAAPAGAQSVLASRGLGYPLEPLDARSRGLGGITTGLAEPVPSFINPASGAGIPAAAFLVAFQPDVYDASGSGVSASGTTARFPLLLGVFPVSPRLSIQVGYGSYLDQHWQVQQSDSITLSTGRVAVNDRFVSSGGVARLQGGVGYRVTERLSLGVSAEAFTGAANDTTTREIGGLSTAETAVTYAYSGVQGGAGVRWQPATAFSASAAVHGGGRIRARADDDSLGTSNREYTSPLRADVGASARLNPSTMLAASASWTGWSSLNDELSASGGSRDAASVTAGVEYTGVTFARKTIPLRLGARYGQLPFRWQGAGTAFPNEKAVSAGLGWSLGGRAALIDAAAERGWRGGGSAGIDEPYWRFSFSLQVLGR